MRSIIIFFIIVTCCLSFVRWENTVWKAPSYFNAPYYKVEVSQLTRAKVELGRKLFYDPILSKNNTISCASCHNSYHAFAHTDHALSHGIYDSIGTRNAPALFNLAWSKELMWDGASFHLDAQALAPIENKIEMDEKLNHVLQKLQANPSYVSAFQTAYGKGPITGEKFLNALQSFQLTLVSANSKYDSVKLEKANFNAQEQSGYQLFTMHCNRCHTEPLFTNHQFADNGLAVNLELNDVGRYRITRKSSDSLKFKVPSLRNLSYTYPYMHDGRFNSLQSVLKHYTKEIVQHPNLDEGLRAGIPLSDKERTDIIAFLLTLNDRSFVFDKQFSQPK